MIDRIEEVTLVETLEECDLMEGLMLDLKVRWVYGY